MNEIKYKLSEDGCSVTGYEIHEIEIPEGVTTIEEEAFLGMNCLKKVKLPSTITKLKNYAFAECGRLEEINIPPALSYIASGAFLHCSSLKHVNIEPSNNHFVVDKGVLYTSDMSVMVHAFNSPENSHITLNENQKAIRFGALMSCLSVTRFTFEIPVERIPAHFFSHCENLKQVDFLDGLRYIGAYAFDSAAIEDINLPNSVEVIEENAFSDCPSLRNITIPEKVKVIRYGTFFNCASLKTVKVGKQLCKIRLDALTGCPNDLQIIVPKGKIVAAYDFCSEIDDFVDEYVRYKHDDAILFIPCELANKISGAEVLSPDKTKEFISQIDLDTLDDLGEDDFQDWYYEDADDYPYDWYLDTFVGNEETEDLDDDDTSDGGGDDYFPSLNDCPF